MTSPVIHATTLATFPSCPTYGFTSQPTYLVKWTMRTQGFERGNRCWARPQIVFSAAPIGERDEADIQSVLRFWHSMGGRKTTFLFKDWTDFKSCQVQQTPTALDQPLVAVTLSDSSTAYQLVKNYTAHNADSTVSFTQSREITKPVASTLLISNAAGTAQTDYTIDELNGLVKPGMSFSGTPTKWGGQFNVPVRFNSELDVQIADSQIQAVNFTLLEKRLSLSRVFV